MPNRPHTVTLYTAQLTHGAIPPRSVAVAASVTRTTPAAMATKKAYAWSQPRMRGLPMSTGLGRIAVSVTEPGYDTVGYSSVGRYPDHSRMAHSPGADTSGGPVGPAAGV